MKIECAWINCKHNSFSISEEMKKEIRNGLEIEGIGVCNCNETIKLSLEEDEETFLICDNYIDGCKFDG